MNLRFVVIIQLVSCVHQSYQLCSRIYKNQPCFYYDRYQTNYKNLSLPQYNREASDCFIHLNNEYGRECNDETEITLFSQGNYRYWSDSKVCNILNSSIHSIKLNAFKDMGNLRKINITDCNVNNVELGAFYGVPNLEYLSLSNNNITSISRGLFNNLSNLKALDLSMNIINLIEKGSFLGVSLKEMYISQNSIQDVRPLIENCPELVILDISHNKISTLVSIGNCRKLLMLNAENNRLKKLSPNQFGQLPLEILDLSSNILNDLDTDTFKGLDNLYSLNLSCNKLDGQPNILEGLTNLHILNLSCNSLTNLSAHQFPQLSLEILDLSSNMLDDIDTETFTGLDNLDILYLSGNNINNGEPKIGIFQHLHNLRVLNISSNSITNLHLGLFSKLAKLQYLNVSNNVLTEIPEEMFHDLKSLRGLYINNNLLTNFNGPSLWEINFDGNPWNCEVLSGIVGFYKDVMVRGTSHNTSSISGISCTKTDTNKIVDVTNNKLNENDKIGYANLFGKFLEGINISLSNGMQKLSEINGENQQNSSNILKEILSQINNNIIKQTDEQRDMIKFGSGILSQFTQKIEQQFEKLSSIINNTHTEKDYTHKQEIIQSEKLAGNIVVPHENSNIFVGVLVVQIVFLIAFCLAVFYFVRSIKIHHKIREMDEIQL